jgi:hypothetical protein
MLRVEMLEDRCNPSPLAEGPVLIVPDDLDLVLSPVERAAVVVEDGVLYAMVAVRDGTNGVIIDATAAVADIVAGSAGVVAPLPCE